MSRTSDNGVFDLAIVGSGFGGSLLAMIARRQGRSVVLLEKGRHPRFTIGESSTPLANLLLEELATRYDLPRLLPLTKWGTWQQTYPEIACGLKRGFTFYHHKFGHRFASRHDRSDQLLVAASPHDGIADTHWYRSDFDHFFVREAQSLGAEYLDEARLRAPSWQDGKAILQGERAGRPFSIQARFVVDATGPRGFLHRALQLPEAPLDGLPPTQALYTHFSGVRRVEELEEMSGAMGCAANVNGDAEAPPYPIDDAALHHVFDGGWIWVLRFNNGLTSAGVAATDALANELGFASGAPGEAAWAGLLDRLPTVRAQFTQAVPQLPFLHAPRLSFRSGVVAGPGWALLPSAAGFVDPLLSTGFPLTLLGVSRLAEAFEGNWDLPNFVEELSSKLQTYATQTENELLAAARLIGALYANMNDFEMFSALSLLYFAAASWSETARRLQKPHLAGAFLLSDHPVFGAQLRACCERARRNLSPAERRELLEQIRRAIEPFDVAGLSKRNRRNWYPVDANDLFAAAGKLQASRHQIQHLLDRCGFSTTHGAAV